LLNNRSLQLRVKEAEQLKREAAESLRLKGSPSADKSTTRRLSLSPDAALQSRSDDTMDLTSVHSISSYESPDNLIAKNNSHAQQQELDSNHQEAAAADNAPRFVPEALKGVEPLLRPGTSVAPPVQNPNTLSAASTNNVDHSTEKKPGSEPDKSSAKVNETAAASKSSQPEQVVADNSEAEKSRAAAISEFLALSETEEEACAQLISALREEPAILVELASRLEPEVFSLLIF
jgi:hypothetical protein